MSGIQKFIAIGHTGADPEIYNFDSGNKAATFSLAVSESYKNKSGEKVEHTEWFNCVAYNKLAEIVEQYVNKGTHLYIEGKVRNRSYETKDGIKKYITEVVVNQLQMLGKKEGGRPAPPEPEETGSQQPSKPEETNSAPGPEPDGADDLPF